MHSWEYQHWTNMATNGIYINNHCDIPHTPHLLDSLSTNNFGRNWTEELPVSSLLQILLAVICFFEISLNQIFKTFFHIFTVESCRSSDTTSVRWTQTQGLVTFPQSPEPHITSKLIRYPTVRHTNTIFFFLQKRQFESFLRYVNII